jgi:hypothetical protein
VPPPLNPGSQLNLCIALLEAGFGLCLAQGLALGLVNPGLGAFRLATSAVVVGFCMTHYLVARKQVGAFRARKQVGAFRARKQVGAIRARKQGAFRLHCTHSGRGHLAPWRVRSFPLAMTCHQIAPPPTHTTPQAAEEQHPVTPALASEEYQAQLEKQDSYIAVSALAATALTIITVLI